VDEVSRFYRVPDQSAGTHLALRWKGRVRYTVPREATGQQACWNFFRPGLLGIPLRAMARLPRFSGSRSCTEGAQITSIREAIGGEIGLSCCRAGAEGVWLKDTVLLLDKENDKPLYLVKAGRGAAVDSLLRNEATWLRTLREERTLAGHIPLLVAHCFGEDFCFVAQCPVSGDIDFRLGASQLDFLRKLQASSLRKLRYEDSSLYKTLNLRLAELEGHLSEAWSARLERAMQRIEGSLSGSPVLLVTAHNDFTPWNIRIFHNFAYVFDWEYAAQEQLPLFDPLHFVLMPMALRSQSTSKIIQNIHSTLKLCREQLGAEQCYEADTQALAYMMNLCTLYLWGDPRRSPSHPALACYALAIDYMCRN
jgi:Phosphotransferase enzyme family